MYEFLDYKVGDFMSRTGVVVGPQTTLGDAESFFEKHDYNLLPVVENLRLVGVLTKTDLLKAFRFGSTSVLPAYSEITGQRIEAFMTAAPETMAAETPLTRV